MSNIVTIAYMTEGSTDQRFLESIILKTFEDVALKCEGEIIVYDPVHIKPNKKSGFVNDVSDLSVYAMNIGINVLCVHVDADDINDNNVLKNKIVPAKEAVNLLPDNKACKNLVSIIPVHTSEAWMIADRELLKEEINIFNTNIELNIPGNPEAISNPKLVIENLLRVAQEHLPKRRNKVTIGELYQPLGQKVNLQKLQELVSFKKFQSSVEDAFRKLNYLY